jgi:hypothetical protein
MFTHSCSATVTDVQNHESSFFSLFALTDKSASFVGPAIVGLISDMTGNIRNGFIFLLIMLAVPVPVLLRVRAKRGKKLLNGPISKRGVLDFREYEIRLLLYIYETSMHRP